MKTQKLDYDYPKELIAEKPTSPRDAARMLVLDKKTGGLEHSFFKDITKYLKNGDVLVFNKTKVFPARIWATKKSGGRIELLFLKEKSPKVWEVMIRGKVGEKEELFLPKKVIVTVSKKEDGYELLVPFTKNEQVAYLEKFGKMPLPPYIKREATKKDVKDYQTVFAEHSGSAAAPTAGLHFTKRLIGRLVKKGVGIEYVTLHVGLGTFQPVKTEKLEDHPIHSEFYEIEKQTAERLNKAKTEGRRIIAVGTTAVRALESAACQGKLVAGQKETALFIYPGYQFCFVDGIITNFHTPKSSLLGLVFAFAGEKNIKKAYSEAIERKYRLFSYGDGMFIK